LRFFVIVILLLLAYATAPTNSGPNDFTTNTPPVKQAPTNRAANPPVNPTDWRNEAAYFRDVLETASGLRPGWRLFPSETKQGGVILVRHHEKNHFEFQGKRISMQPFQNGFYAYLAIDADLSPGKYTVGDQILTVQAASFSVQKLIVSQQTEQLRRDTKRIQKDQAIIRAARRTVTEDFLFPPRSAFVRPAEGRLSTPYGYTRYVNGSFAGRHMAIDIAAPKGTPVYATNDGVVLLAESFLLPGDTIYIDHGMALFSQYAHLSEIFVKKGEHVTAGQRIGSIGSTGYSTGPHLHFTFWVAQTPVDPDLFFGRTPFDWAQ
jgi:murein DD-endopeptidase MepM/ murein hydrolase activator NlpD